MGAGQPPGHNSSAQVLATFIANLEAALSPDRLAPFRLPGGDDLAMAATYLWNVAICRELYTSLGMLEVALRNSIYSTLATHFGRDDWYDRPNLLQRRELVDVARAKGFVVEAKHLVIPPRVVASLTFGFWTSLLDGAYGNPIWTPPPTTISVLIPQVFPHASAHFQTRGRAHERINAVRKLRNRVFHFEPVWNRTDLVREHQEIVEAIGWVSPTLHAATVAFDRFPDVYQNGPTGIVTDLKAHIGIT